MSSWGSAFLGGGGFALPGEQTPHSRRVDPHPHQEGRPPSPSGQNPQEGRHPRKADLLNTYLGRTPKYIFRYIPQPPPPPGNTVNGWVVSILLECIFVFRYFRILENGQLVGNDIRIQGVKKRSRAPNSSVCPKSFVSNQKEAAKSYRTLVYILNLVALYFTVDNSRF